MGATLSLHIMKTVHPPAWLQEEPALLGLLHQFIDRFDQGPIDDIDNKLTLRLTRKSCPELYSEREEAEYVWSLIRSLDKQYQIWMVKGPRAKPGEPGFENLRLEFNLDAEACVREWLHRPLIDPYALIWQEAVEKNANHWPTSMRFMLNAPLRYENRSAEEMVKALKSFSMLGQGLTLREGSARCFWGDSKFAEAKEVWLREVFPVQMRKMHPRPILLNVVVPRDVQGVLWIENQDSFLRFVYHPPAEAEALVLIYCAGFHATSPRIREPGHAVFCAVDTNRHVQSTAILNSLWRGEISLPCYFWGDLDFAGMGILASLRIAFPDAQAWEPGYRHLVDALHSGQGHTPEGAGKELQTDPNVTGCRYADHVLLPLLRRSNLALDQEAVDWDSQK